MLYSHTHLIPGKKARIRHDIAQKINRIINSISESGIKRGLMLCKLITLRGYDLLLIMHSAPSLLCFFSLRTALFAAHQLYGMPAALRYKYPVN
ncbi:hypothetical protein ASF13_10280 [Erwinia sp. Leaf53]|nr:hypothetical protein ASF13_10280 [Erwinia sp. Leaf53]